MVVVEAIVPLFDLQTQVWSFLHEVNRAAITNNDKIIFFMGLIYWFKSKIIFFTLSGCKVQIILFEEKATS